MASAPPLARELAGARDFDAAAAIVLDRALQEAQRALAAERGARVLRGVLLHRPERGAQGVAVVDLVPSPVRALPSATAWRWVSLTGEPVAIDVEARRVLTVSGKRVDSTEGRLGDFGSRAALLGRGATHVLGVPLRRGGGAPEGVLCIEVECRAAVGGTIRAWSSCAPVLQHMADAATSVLALLPHGPSAPADPLLPVVGAAMAGVVRVLGTFATLDETLLLRGPTGTGKSRLARWVHARSTRAAGPFVTLQLHAVPDGLREGQLFGWKRGAFTGAVRDHAGAVERAEGGTLFLDEVDRLPLSAQGKLLRMLEERRYASLGDPRERRAEVRFVVATNADLEREVREGRFLPDLYYRVNILPVELPPLGARRDEIAGWARWMLAQVAADPAGVELDPDAIALLEAREWPGNLRQLHAVVLRAYAFARAASGDRIRITRTETTRACTLDAPISGGEPVLDAMSRAAAAFVEASAKRSALGQPPLAIELADAFVGMVLEAAVARYGDPRTAFLELGLEERLKGGNHLKTLRREQEKLQALAAALRGP